MSRMLEHGLMALYGSLWHLARPLLRRHKRLHDDFDMRLVPENWSGTADIWVQAASGGEAYLAWEWLRALPFFTEDPSALSHMTSIYDAAQPRPSHILLTSCTRQGLDVLQEAADWAKEQCTARGIQGFSITVQVFPLDQPRLMRRAIEQVAPRMLVILETELWPSLMQACRNASVPVMVLNGRMSPRSFGAYYFLRSFWKNLAPRHIVAISHDDAMRFSMLFGVDVDVVPNMKFDRVCMGEAKEGEEAKCASIASLLPKKKNMLLGSVREEEETLLLSTICQLYQLCQCEEEATKSEGAKLKGDKSEELSIIIAPRHMHRVGAWQEGLQRVGLHPVLRSELGKSGENASACVSKVRKGASPSVIIWDTFGELDALYSLADAAFVGGSLMPLGGQNFLEPLGKGLVPCVGPYLDNFAWVEPKSLENAGLLQVVRTDVELAQALWSAVHGDVQSGKSDKEQNLVMQGTPTNREMVKACFRDWLGSRQGGAQACAQLTMNMLNGDTAR